MPAGEAAISPLDRTLLYGFGAFETFRLYGGVPFLVERHLERVRGTLRSLALEAPPALDLLPQQVPQLAQACGVTDALCRVTVTSGGAAEGPAVAPQRVFVQLRAAPAHWEGRRVVVGLAPGLHDPDSPTTGVKSTSYLAHYLQRERAEAQGRLDDVLLDRQGRVSEGTVSSVFFVLDDGLVTAPLADGVLAGVTRSEVLGLAAEQGLSVHERSAQLDEARQAQECFLTGAGKALVSVDEFAGQSLPSHRPVAQALALALARSIARCCGVPLESVRF